MNAYVGDFRDKVRRAYANEKSGYNETKLVRLFVAGLNSETLRLKTLEQHCHTLDEAPEYVLSVVTLQELAKTKPTVQKATLPGFQAGVQAKGMEPTQSAQYSARPPGF